jgi:tetratricopeptide (TPR) repeat protein
MISRRFSLLARAAWSLVACASLVACTSLFGGCASPGDLTDEQKTKLIDGYTEQAEQYLQMGELDRAQGQTEKGLLLDPQNFKLKLIRGLTLQKRGKTDDVIKAEAMVRDILDSGDYRVSLGLGMALERKGLAFSEAANDIRSGKRVSEAPDPKKRADELANEAQHAWTESVERYSAALAGHSGDTDAMNGLVRVTALLGRDAESLAWADQLLDACQTDLAFWQQRLARSSITAGEEEYFRRLIQSITEVQLATHIHASALLHRAGRDAEALAQVDAALAIKPDQAALFSRRAELQKDLRRYEEAIKDIDTYLRLAPQSFDHPDIKRAWRLRRECEEELRTARAH